jgi:hypothetical protein
MKRCCARLMLAALLVAAAAPVARAEPEPWSAHDGMGVPTRQAFGAYGFELGAEYRANFLYVNPIDLNSTYDRRASWIEHRLRLDAAVDYDQKVRLVTSIDALNGTLWGDNGTFGGSPSPNSGTNAAVRNPNNASVGVGYQSGDPLDPGSYGFVLKPNDYFFVRRLYGDILTPIGLIRIGRQPTIIGASILANDGDGRTNRFGYSGDGDSVDRVLFATKPLEGLKPAGQRDTSADRGLFWVAFYDHLAENQVYLFGDNVNGIGTGLRYLNPDPVHEQGAELDAFYSHRWQTEYDTDINITSLRAIGHLGKLSAGAEGGYIFGATREVSQALALINNDPVVRQSVQQWGARGVVRWDEPMWTAYFETDFASGDSNPNPGTPLTEFYFSQDTGVGLLMFQRILAFSSARASAAGVALLQQLGAKTFPAERINTRGAFTNAVAIFPQFDFRPLPKLLLRGGMLMAWAPTGLVSPTESLKRRVGNDIEKALVNYDGGKPGHFYGTELDGRFEWRYLDHFIFDLEGAILFPGDVFWDQNDQAVRSVLVQGRTTFVF